MRPCFRSGKLPPRGIVGFRSLLYKQPRPKVRTKPKPRNFNEFGVPRNNLPGTSICYSMRYGNYDKSELKSPARGLFYADQGIGSVKSSQACYSIDHTSRRPLPRRHRCGGGNLDVYEGHSTPPPFHSGRLRNRPILVDAFAPAALAVIHGVPLRRPGPKNEVSDACPW